ncbi:MAG TPA: DoxX family membrane protein [Aggregatilineales bacterium]|nr:DoxX family membrane protein [Aggregatilineales bacterium]
MKSLQALFGRVDTRITMLMSRYGIVALRISVGVVFFWFGFLKFFPDLSPAQDLAARTIEKLTFGIMQPEIALPILALWETLIGIGLITGKFMRVTLLLLFFQMLGTITPIFFFPEETFTRFPYAPTLEGQYIIKNMVLVSAAFVIGATVRGGNLIADPEAHRTARQIEDDNVRKSMNQFVESDTY